MEHPTAPSAQSAAVFLSYARTDRAVAEQVANALATGGIEVWWDAELKTADAWQEALHREVGRCKAFLVLIGHQGVSGWVGAEVGLALNRHFSRSADASLPIVPVLIGDTSPEQLPPFLELFQGTQLSIPPKPEDVASLVAEIRDRVEQQYRKPDLPWGPDECPFPGLAPFTERQRALFFGRHSDLLNALDGFRERQPDGRPRRWLRIEGNSGVGKSSLLYAGIVPSINRGWLNLGATDVKPRIVGTMRPGTGPLRNLAIELAKTTHRATEALLERMSGAGFKLGNLLAESSDGDGREIPVLIIDQFEELLTLSAEAEARRFDTLLSDALSDDEHPLYLITTMRSDFLGQFEERLPSLSALRAAAGRAELLPVTAAGLRDIVYRPVQMLGLEYGDPELPEDIIAEALAEPGALPLVGNLLRLMWEKRNGGPLSRQVYKELGGVAGALSVSADRVLDSFGAKRKEKALNLLLRTVKLGSETAHSSQQISREEAIDAAGGAREGEAILEPFPGSATRMRLRKRPAAFVSCCRPPSRRRRGMASGSWST